MARHPTLAALRNSSSPQRACAVKCSPRMAPGQRHASRAFIAHNRALCLTGWLWDSNGRGEWGGRGSRRHSSINKWQSEGNYTQQGGCLSKGLGVCGEVLKMSLNWEDRRLLSWESWESLFFLEQVEQDTVRSEEEDFVFVPFHCIENAGVFIYSTLFGVYFSLSNIYYKC